MCLHSMLASRTARTKAAQRHRRLTLSFLLLGLAILVCTPGAQGQIYTASVSGTVRDTSGAVVPEATLSLINVATQVENRSVSNATGNFLFSNLQPGTYTL